MPFLSGGLVNAIFCVWGFENAINMLYLWISKISWDMTCKVISWDYIVSLKGNGEAHIDILEQSLKYKNIFSNS